MCRAILFSTEIRFSFGFFVCLFPSFSSFGAALLQHQQQQQWNEFLSLSCTTKHWLSFILLLWRSMFFVHFSRDNFNIYYIIAIAIEMQTLLHTWGMLLLAVPCSFSFSLLLVIVMCSNSISYDIKHRNISFSEYFLCGARSVGFFS